ncbi:MAG: M24 family metallopeptidase [Alphaproteobacteria bacterium]
MAKAMPKRTQFVPRIVAGKRKSAQPSPMEVAARTTPVNRLSDTEGRIDMVKLRAFRLGRVRAELKRRDYGACVLFDPLSIRYATGSRGHSVFLTHIPGRYLFLPAAGPVVLFESDAYRHTGAALETIDEIRPPKPMSFFAGGDRLSDQEIKFADEIAGLVKKHCGRNRRVAVDRVGVRIPAALEARGLKLFDVIEPIERARAIKSPEEILCMNFAIATGEVGAARMHEALRPGLTENELWALLHQANIAMGGEWIEARLLCAGDRTNPWLQETSDRVIRPGELVAFDTDMIGPLGYCADFSRTFHCGPGKPTPEQRDLYKTAYEEISYNLALLKPGLSFREYTQKHWKQPEKYIKNRYPFIVHGIGMSDEWPGIYYRQDYPAYGYDGVIEENMTLCVESYIGAEGGRQGVKLEHQVLVTKNGYELLSQFPFDDSLLA